MTITSTEETKNKKMVRIFIDDHYAFTIPKVDYISNHLYTEEKITVEQLNHIKEKVLLRAAKERGMSYLTIKDRSEDEIYNKLIEAGFDADISKNAVEALKALGYLDDRRYAMRYLTYRASMKAMSRKSLRYELERKGISNELLDEVLSEFEMDDQEVALRAAKKKFGKYDLNDQKIKNKVLRFLYHRGFTYEIGQKVLRIMKED